MHGVGQFKRVAIADAVMNQALDAIRSFRRFSTAYPGQWLYRFGDEGLIYSERENRFAGLDAAGVSAYLALEAGAGIGDLRGLNHKDSRGAPSDDGLEAIEALTQGIFPAEDSPNELPTSCLTTLVPPSAGNSKSESIEIGGIPVLLEYPSGQLERLCCDYFQHCPATRQSPHYHLCARRAETGWAIYVNDRELLSLTQEEQLGLGLMYAARTMLYAKADYDVAFHAAAVAHGDCAVLLCAPRECGKSTLTAYLVACGFDLLSDEPALLDLDNCAVSALPLPISLKEGSWTSLQNEIPLFSCGPVHVRSDGLRILLAHPLAEHRTAQARRLKRILFPKYEASSAGHSQRLTPLRTLERLNRGGMLLAKDLGRDKFEDFLALVCRIPADEIRYGSLEEAWRLLHELGYAVPNQVRA
jgi:hypothetical protein